MILIVSVFLGAGCKRKETNAEPRREILVQIGDSILYQSDVERQIPSGLNSEDSLSLFKSITERWIRNLIMTEIATANIKDIEKINTLTEQYRNDLIVDAYLKSKEEEIEDISSSAIQAYYKANEKDMLAKSPLIQGIYLKIPENEDKITNIRKWLKEGSASSIDKLEKSGLTNAAQYDFFKNQWIEWSDVAEKIPYRFYDADAFLRTTRFFETTYEGWTYMLYIYNCTHTGDRLPKEYAIKRVKEILRNEKLMDLRENLLIDLYKKGINEKTITPGLYDLVRHQTISPKDK